MQELELTWSQVIRIWWAAFWRWIVLANLTSGVFGGTLGIALLIIGHREWGHSIWWVNGYLAAYIPAGIIAIRLALKAKYKDFRIAIIAQEPG